MEDFVRKNVQIACLQETHCEDMRFESREGNGTIVCLQGQLENANKRYDQGFYMSAQWEDSFWGVKRLSDRISIIQFNLAKTGDKDALLTLINVYALASQLSRMNEMELLNFYGELT